MRQGSKSSPLSIRFIPARAQDPAWEIEMTVPREGIDLVRETRDGWIEFTSPDRLRGTFENTQNESLAPRPIGLATTLASFDLDPITWLAFDIHHVAELPTPIRVDIRAAWPVGITSEDSGGRSEGGSSTVPDEIEFRLLDRAERVVEHGTFTRKQVTSRYDRSLRATPDAARVSDPVSFFLALPRTISRLELRGRGHQSALLYSRPPELPRAVRVPEDYRPVVVDGGRIPAWFSIEPINADELARTGRQHRIIVQPRPRESDPRILAGDYEWKSFRPNGNWSGSDLLSPRVPRTTHTPLRLAGLSSSYLALPTNEVQTVDLSASRGRKRVQSRLIFVRNESQPSAVRVDVDGETVASEPIAGRHGSIDLPMLDVGMRRIEIHSDSETRWFINHARDEGPRLSRHLGIRFDAGSPLEFDFKKRDAEELLTLLIHSPADAKIPTQVSVELLAPDAPTSRALAGWTHRERRFEIAPRSDESVFVLDSARESTGLGQRLFVPLASDLAPGSYRLRVALIAGPPGYVSLYRVRTGARVTRRVLREDTI
jgi:hypothetical protein